MKDLIRNTASAIRVNQWYKNAVIFMPLTLSGRFLDFTLVALCSVGFVIFCMVSSGNYIINDILDIKKDKFNPEKSRKPIASGKISAPYAVLLAAILLSLGIAFAYSMSVDFMSILLLFCAVSIAYSFFLKNFVIIDVVTISTNFALRAMAGYAIIGAEPSFLLIAGVFFFAAFLVLGKRHGEIDYLKDDAFKYRPVLEFYSKKSIKVYLIVLLFLIIVIFLLYCYLSGPIQLMLTAPLFVFMLSRYNSIIISGNKIVRNPGSFVTDMPLLLVTAFFVTSVIILII